MERCNEAKISRADTNETYNVESTLHSRRAISFLIVSNEYRRLAAYTTAKLHKPLAAGLLPAAGPDRIHPDPESRIRSATELSLEEERVLVGDAHRHVVALGRRRDAFAVVRCAGV